MSHLASTVRRIGIAVFGSVLASVVAAASCQAQTEPRVVKIATCGECKPLAWGARKVRLSGALDFGPRPRQRA